MEENELLEIISQVDQLINKLKTNQVSKEDIESLKETIFHLDALIIKIKKEEKDFPLLPQLIDDLQTANNHLRRVWLDEEQTTFSHSDPHKQHEHDRFFASLLKQIKSV